MADAALPGPRPAAAPSRRAAPRSRARGGDRRRRGLLGVGGGSGLRGDARAGRLLGDVVRPVQARRAAACKGARLRGAAQARGVRAQPPTSSPCHIIGGRQGVGARGGRTRRARGRRIIISTLQRPWQHCHARARAKDAAPGGAAKACFLPRSSGRPPGLSFWLRVCREWADRRLLPSTLRPWLLSLLALLHLPV